MKIPKNATVIIDDVECVMEYWYNNLTFKSKKSTDLNLVGRKGMLIFIPRKAKYNKSLEPTIKDGSLS